VFVDLRWMRRYLAAYGSALHGDRDDIAGGQKLFQKSCIAYHGGSAKGGMDLDLSTREWRWERLDDAIVKNVTQHYASAEPLIGNHNNGRI